MAAPITTNSQRLDALVHNGKIYLSLADAIVLGLENNYDIAIQRYNLDIADTDLLRARAGSNLLGVSSGLVEGTLSGSGDQFQLAQLGRRSRGHLDCGRRRRRRRRRHRGHHQRHWSARRSNGPGAYGNPAAGTDNDPSADTVWQRRPNPESEHGFEYNFNYNQGFITGTQLQVAFDNSRITSNSIFNAYSPELQSTFRATVTQHLLNGFGPGINGRFILEAKNDRRITDSAFRQQILYTINQIENIYWVLVGDYEDVQAKQRGLEQSTRLASDNRKQLQIGTLAPLDVLNADNQVSTDTQALITSQTTA